MCMNIYIKMDEDISDQIPSGEPFIIRSIEEIDAAHCHEEDESPEAEAPEAEAPEAEAPDAEEPEAEEDDIEMEDTSLYELKALREVDDILSPDNCETFRQTPRTVWRSVNSWGTSLEYVRPELITYELCKCAINRDEYAIGSVPREKFTENQYHDLCMMAVSGNGFVLKEIPEPAITAEIVEAALGFTCCAIMFAPHKFLTPQNCMKAIKQNGEMLQYVPEEYITEEMRQMAAESIKENRRISSERSKIMTEQLMRDGEISCPIQ
jgi:hypothetical protein